MPSFGNFVHTQFILNIPVPTASFAEKTVIVTGGNGGLGQEIIKHIVRLKASKVILACRSRSRGEQAKKDIETATSCPADVIEVWELDIASASSIKSFVDKVSTLSRLDVLINNAGIQNAPFELIYGTERTLAVNVVGTMLLTIQLIPKLKETARTYKVVPHLTFVGSALYDVAKYPDPHCDDIFDWFQDEKHVNRMGQYNLSKLLLLYAIIKLSARVEPPSATNPSPIVINSLDPCFCKTGLPGDMKGGVKVAFKIFETIAARSPEEGARLVVLAASAGPETHGLYMRAGAVQEYFPIAKDEKKASHVWDSLIKKLEGIQPGILENL